MSNLSLDEMTEAMQRHTDQALLKKKPFPQSHPRWFSKTRLSFWFPKIAAAGLPVPRTRIVKVKDEEFVNLYTWMHDPEHPSPKAWEDLIAALTKARDGIAGPGQPYFLRTDFTAGKHDWKSTCFVECSAANENHDGLLGRHMYRLFEYSEMADMIGLPTDVWVVREMLDTEPVFHAFSGLMPIVREFRLFVVGGKVDHIQPYWAPAAFEKKTDTSLCGEIKDPFMPADGWQLELERINRITDNERRLLRIMSLDAVAAIGEGDWSVDWLETVDRGWVLIDMAGAAESFKWAGK